MKTYKKIVALLAIAFSLALLQSCKDKNPSMAKIFVRSANNELISDVRVVIIADIDANDAKIEYVDTLMTNASGYVEFNLDEYFTQAGKSVKVGNFDVLCRLGTLEAESTIRARVNNTAVETVRL